MPAAGYRHRANRWIPELRQDPIHAVRQIFESGGRYGFRGAEHMQAEIDVVDQQVQHCAAALRGVGEPGAPGGRGAPPAKNGCAHRAQPPGAEDIGGGAIRRNETHHVGGHQDAAVAPGGGDHAIGRCAIERHGLFDQHVFARIQRQHRDALVQGRGQADIDGFHRGVQYGLFGARVLGYRREIQLPGLAAEVALDAGEVAGQTARVEARHSGQFRAGDLPPGIHVRAAHEAQAENRDLHDGFRATNIFKGGNVSRQNGPRNSTANPTPAKIAAYFPVNL